MPDRLADHGITLLTMIFGFVGAALGISYMPPMSKKQMVVALLAGLACAAMIPQAADWVWVRYLATPMPGVFNNIVAFCSGLFGMFIVPGLLVIGTTFKSNPWVLVDWWRGRGGPPAPPPPSVPPGGQP